jgi:hypothetical protein
MTVNELNDKLSFLEEIYENEKSRLKRFYALSNNNVKIGDIISDKTNTIKVETIGIYLSSIPQCIYTGIELTKQGLPNKKKTKIKICQENIRKNADK